MGDAGPSTHRGDLTVVVVVIASSSASVATCSSLDDLYGPLRTTTSGLITADLALDDRASLAAAADINASFSSILLSFKYGGDKDVGGGDKDAGGGDVTIRAGSSDVGLGLICGRQSTAQRAANSTDGLFRPTA